MYKIDRNEFFKRIKSNTQSMNKVVRHKLDFIAERLKSLLDTLALSLPPQYNTNPLEVSFESISSRRSSGSSFDEDLEKPTNKNVR